MLPVPTPDMAPNRWLPSTNTWTRRNGKRQRRRFPWSLRSSKISRRGLTKPLKIWNVESLSNNRENNSAFSESEILLSFRREAKCTKNSYFVPLGVITNRVPSSEKKICRTPCFRQLLVQAFIAGSSIIFVPCCIFTQACEH